jgi:hypothetical protein
MLIEEERVGFATIEESYSYEPSGSLHTGTP